MTPEEQALVFWIQVPLVLAAICTTAFPLIYAFSPWYKSSMGRALMNLGVALAVAVDLTLYFTFWPPDSLYAVFWINVVCFAFLAISAGFLTYRMIRANFIRRKAQHKNERLHSRA